jgi:hypothetical protein
VLIGAIRVWSSRLDEMVTLNGFHAGECFRALLLLNAPRNFAGQALSDDNANYKTADIVNCKVAVISILNVHPIIQQQSDLGLLSSL